MENIVVEGEIAHFEQFHLFPQCFPKAFFFNVLKRVHMEERVNSLPHDKFLDWSKLKALADKKMMVTEKFIFILGRVENIMGKAENAGYQHFLLFL